MTNSQKNQCHAIIHTATAACTAVGGGMAQIPFSDAVPITAAQVTMVIGLGKVFGKSITETGAKALITGIAGPAIGRLVSQVLVGWIPGIGNAINATTAAGLTELIGWTVAKQFDNETKHQIKEQKSE